MSSSSRRRTIPSSPPWRRQRDDLADERHCPALRRTGPLPLSLKRPRDEVILRENANQVALQRFPSLKRPRAKVILRENANHVALPRVTRVGACVDPVIRGLIFEHSDGMRVGDVLTKDNEEVDPYDDTRLSHEGIKWCTLGHNEMIVEVRYFPTAYGYLVGGVVLITDRRHEIKFIGMAPEQIEKKACRYIEETGCIYDIYFIDGTFSCTNEEAARKRELPCFETGPVLSKRTCAMPSRHDASEGNATLSCQSTQRCAHPDCDYAVHSNPRVSEKYCCKACEKNSKAARPPDHGQLCERRAAVRPRPVRGTVGQLRTCPEQPTRTASRQPRLDEAIRRLPRREVPSITPRLDELALSEVEEVERALETKQAWRNYIESEEMTSRFQTLEAHLNDDYKKTKIWPPCLCGAQMGRGVAHHVAGQMHWNYVWKRFHGPRQRVLQAFPLCHGRLVFDHLTCMSLMDDTGELGDVSEPVLELSRPAVAKQRQAVAPLFQVAFLHDSNLSGTRCLPFGYDVGCSRETSTDDAGNRFGWTEEEKWFCAFAEPRGNYAVRLGVFVEDANDREALVQNGRAYVNGVPICFDIARMFVEMVLDVPIDGRLAIRGLRHKDLSYLQVWPTGALAPTRMPEHPPSVAPAFTRAARGTPMDWNLQDDMSWEDQEHIGLFWSPRAAQCLREEYPEAPENAVVDINTMLSFLQKRKVLHKFGPPVAHQNGWYSLSWRSFDARREAETRAWSRAWHGCKMEAVYSISFDGKLRESRSEQRGERMLMGSPGVYVHGDSTAEKAENYSRFVPLGKQRDGSQDWDGVFWSPKWEVRVNRIDGKVKPRRGTDQWVQSESSVQLVALWLCGRSREQMRKGDGLAPRWNPTLEANPFGAGDAAAVDRRSVGRRSVGRGRLG